MRLRPEGDGDRYVVWMDTEEYRDYRAAAPDTEHRLIVRLMAESGVRVAAMPSVNLNDHEVLNNRHFLQVPNYNSPRGAEFRDVFVPDGLFEKLEAFRASEGISPEEPLFDYAKRTIQKRVNAVSDIAAKSTGNEDYGHVSSKDLKRYYAMKLLAEDRLNPRVVVEMGGWSHLDSLQNYIPFPDQETAFDELERYTEVTADGS